jgi:uncharacterized protein
MMKILVLVAVIAGVYFLFFRKPRKKPEKPPKEMEETLTPCEACGTYVSHDEAVIKDGRFFCSKSCAKLPR